MQHATYIHTQIIKPMYTLKETLPSYLQKLKMFGNEVRVRYSADIFEVFVKEKY